MSELDELKETLDKYIKEAEVLDLLILRLQKRMAKMQDPGPSLLSALADNEVCSTPATEEGKD